MLIKESNMKREIDAMPRIDVNTQLSRDFRQDYTMKAIVKYGKYRTKLESLLSRQQRLQGDTWMVAASIVYLGALPMQQRMRARSELSEHLTLRVDLEVSECWANT